MNLANHQELYDRYVRRLEAEHTGQYVAVNADGQFVVDEDDIRVVDEALKSFGPGNFVLLKIGSKGVGKWRCRRPL